MKVMITPDAGLEMLRAQVVNIVLGTIFLSIGATACAIAAIRWRRGVRILIWWGIWSGMYGLQTLDRTPAVLAVLPHALKSATPYVSTAIMYLLLPTSKAHVYGPSNQAACFRALNVKAEPDISGWKSLKPEAVKYCSISERSNT